MESVIVASGACRNAPHLNHEAKKRSTALGWLATTETRSEHPGRFAGKETAWAARATTRIDPRSM